MCLCVRESEREWVGVCVCERERERVCVCERERECVCVRSTWSPIVSTALPPIMVDPCRKVAVRLPGKGNGARPVHQIITMIKWIRTSRVSIKNSLFDPCGGGDACENASLLLRLLYYSQA